MLRITEQHTTQYNVSIFSAGRLENLCNSFLSTASSPEVLGITCKMRQQEFSPVFISDWGVSVVSTAF